MTHRTSQFEKSQGEIPDREGDESSLGSVFAPSEDKSEPHITNKRRGRKLGQRLERLDGELTAQRAVEGGRGEPGAQILISKRGRDGGAIPSSTKCCRLCAAPARYSVACVISTLGIRPRIQQCSPVVLLCHSCIHAICSEETPAPFTLKDELRCAYTTITRRDLMPMPRPDHGE